MKNRIKNLVATSLVGFVAFTAVPSAALANTEEAVSAQELVNALSDDAFVNEMSLYAIEKSNIDLNECSRVKAIFDTAYKEHDIIYENGQIVVNESLNNKISETDYDTIVSDMEIMNTCIESGMASFNQLTGSFVVADVETVINNVPAQMMKSEKEAISPRVLSLDLGSVVSENYAYIEDYYNTLMTYTPTEAYTGTVGIWVGKVAPKGDWDYKRTYGPYDTPYTCTYGLNDSKTRLKTAEFIGNYNYGYTGSFLFNLNALKTGSFVVSGFDASDYTDHPAIEEGFEDANLIE